MLRTDREEDRMHDGDDNVSPYLRLPLRSYANVIRGREGNSGRARAGSEQFASPQPPRERSDDADRGER